MNGNNVDLLVKMNLGATNGGKIDIKDMDVNIDLNDMEAELECLFPKYKHKIRLYVSSQLLTFQKWKMLSTKIPQVL